MLKVSETWKDAIKQQFRNQGYLRVTLAVAPPGLPDEATVSSVDSDPSNIAPPENVVLKAVSTPQAVVSLEPNRWLLDGSFSLMQDLYGSVSGWWSSLSYASPKVLTFEFAQPYSIPGITVYWDLVSATTPTSVKLVGYQGDDVVYSYSYDTTNHTFAPVDAFDAAMTEITRVDLAVNTWKPNTWRARVAAVVFGFYESYDSINRGRVLSGETVDTVDLLSNSLPVHTVSVRLRNFDRYFDPTLQTGLSPYLAQRQLVQVQWGFATSPGQVEWAPASSYYINSFDLPADSKEITLNATSRLAFLTQTYNRSKYKAQKRTLHNVAAEVLVASNVIKETTKEVPWNLSTKLLNCYTRAPIPAMATNTILQLVAGAGCCWLTTEPDTGFVSLTDKLHSSSTVVGLQQQLGDPSIALQEALHTVSVGLYTYSVSTEVTELAKSTYTVSGVQELEIPYNVAFATDVTYTLLSGSGVRVKEFNPYSSCAVLVVESTQQSATFELVVKGKEIEQSVTYVQTYKNEELSKGLDLVVENPFITEPESLQEVSDWVVRWYSRRQLMTLPYLGYPEVTAGDECNVTTIYGQEPEATITSNKITFNGAFNGTLEVR